MNDRSSIQLLVNIGPELVLIATATFLYLASAFTKQPHSRLVAATLGYLTAGLGLGVQATMMTPDMFVGITPPPPGGLVALDALAFFCRVLAVLGGLTLTWAAANGGGAKLSGEFLGSLMLAVSGVMLASGAMDLVFLFIALELVSIPTYVLLYLGGRDRQAGEATAKYFFLSVLSSAILLYGFSLLYGAAGSTELMRIKSALYGSLDGAASLAIVAAVMIVAGLSFKIAAVPFHFYAPDVYQGTSSANAGLLAVMPKIAGIVVLVRLIGAGTPGFERYGWQLAVVLAVLTMTLGNLAALWQNNLRRMMAYSSIAHSGYMLIGLAVALVLAESDEHRHSGLSAMVFYLAVYVLATIGMFATLAYLGSREREVNTVDELAGLIKTRPLAAAAMGICLFSLTGIPPLAGFWGKLSLFGGALLASWSATDATAQVALIALAIIGVLNAAVSAAYYLRIIGTMYFRPTVSAPAAQGPLSALGAGVACALLVLVVGMLPGWLLTSAAGAGRAAVTTTNSYHAQDPHRVESPRAVGGDSLAQSRPAK
jgi:NADH-quinone oxidoreductase subunit N